MMIMFFKSVCLYTTLTSPSLRKSSVPIKEPHSYYIYCNTLTVTPSQMVNFVDMGSGWTVQANNPLHVLWQSMVKTVPGILQLAR